MKQLAQILSDYLYGTKHFGDIAEWLSGVDWDNPALTVEGKESLGLFELLTTEVSEGLRDERELRKEASLFVASNFPRVSTRG